MPEARDGKTVLVLPPAHRQEPRLASHLTFALKHEGVNLEVPAALFERIDLEPFERDLDELVAADAICDRVAHNAVRVAPKGESFRKVKERRTAGLTKRTESDR